MKYLLLQYYVYILRLLHSKDCLTARPCAVMLILPCRVEGVRAESVACVVIETGLGCRGEDRELRQS